MTYILLILGLMQISCAQDTNKEPEQAEETTCKLQGKVIKVTDGDTVNVLDADKTTHKIRLAGIDAPELGQAYGQAARKFLAKQVNQKTVCVDWHKRDKYQRLVGVIKHEGRDVNLDIVKAGYAWHYKKYQKERKNKHHPIESSTHKQRLRHALRSLVCGQSQIRLPPQTGAREKRKEQKLQSQFL